MPSDQDEYLPWPRHDRLHHWWTENAGSFQSDVAYLSGVSDSNSESLIAILRNGYQRQRVEAAYCLAKVAQENQETISENMIPFDVSWPAFKQQALLDRIETAG